jgi:hypothetical protein
MTTTPRSLLLTGATALLIAGLALSVLWRHEPVFADTGAEHGFSNADVRGNWGFNTSFGQVVQPGGLARLPTAAMGRVTFDGSGGCKVLSYVNIDGVTQRLESSRCQYSVGADGIGKSEAVFPDLPGGSVPVIFVIVDNRQELRFLSAGSIVGTFTARRQ